MSGLTFNPLRKVNNRVCYCCQTLNHDINEVLAEYRSCIWLGYENIPQECILLSEFVLFADRKEHILKNFLRQDS